MNLLISIKNYTKRHFILPELALQKDYKRIKKRVLFYRFTFVFLGILFAYLSATLYFHNPNWILHHVFLKGLLVKNSLTAISFTLSLIALWFGCHIRTSIELAKTYTYETLSRIKGAYNEMSDQLSHHHYRMTVEGIKKSYKDTLYHIERIHGLPALSDSEKFRIKMSHLKKLKERLEKVHLI